jgi:peptide deformylase
MAERAILTYPDPRLRAEARPVTAFDESLVTLVGDLTDTLARHAALGLSATQIGDDRRVLVIAPPGAAGPGVYVNPAITARAAWGFVEESCLSVPGVAGSVVRATRIRVAALDRDGAPFEEDLEGLAAVSLQHEVDHLDGRLFFDRFSFIGRMRVRRRLGPEPRIDVAAASGRVPEPAPDARR